MDDLQEFDFIDLGASSGGSIDFARRVLGGVHALGIDIDPEKIAQMREKGFDCLEADVTNLKLPENSVRFVVMSHFLEHLPSLDHVRLAIDSAARVAREFIFIQGPFFDADEELASHGLKFYWSDWSGHSCHLTTRQLIDILEYLGLNNYQLMLSGEVASSDDPSIHPVASPVNQHLYESASHPAKPQIDFHQCLFREIVCLIRIGEMPEWAGLIQRVGEKKRAIFVGAPTDQENYPKVSHPSTRSDSTTNQASRRLEKVSVLLLLQRRWHYLHYLHLRDAVIRSGAVNTMFVIGVDRGLSAIALAVEFPRIQFLAAHLREGTEVFYKAHEIATEWSLTNINFLCGGLGCLEPASRFGLIALSEILHLVDDPGHLVSAALESAGTAVFATVPLIADQYDEPGPKITDRGTTIADMESLFPDGEIRGCYWRHCGVLLRRRLSEMSDQAIRAHSAQLMLDGLSDLIASPPRHRHEALAISSLTLRRCG